MSDFITLRVNSYMFFLIMLICMITTFQSLKITLHPANVVVLVIPIQMHSYFINCLLAFLS